MKLLVTTTYHEVDRTFINWMAEEMKDGNFITNEQACKLRKDGELEVTKRSEDPKDKSSSTTKWEVIP